MFIVMPEKAHKDKFAPLGKTWAHTTPDSAIGHALARQRFEGETYLVLNEGKVIFQAKS
jgi:hypothetical protein